MVEKISVQIALEGGKEVEQQLAAIGEAGQKAFEDISKSAEQVGGFKNLQPEEVTNKLKAVGLEGTAAFEKIQKAVQSASRWESVVQGVEALETGFLAVAKAAGVVAAAVAAATLALSKYTSEAAKVSEELAPLADLSGKSAESVSALQIAFAQSGESAQKFAQEFGNLEQKVQEASRTMADDVEQSSQKIARAHQNVEQAATSVASAELGLQQAQLQQRKQVFGERDPAAEKRLADARANLAVQEASQRLAAAQLAQQKAVHDARVAEANDLGKISELYQKMAAGVKVAFDPLTTQATKNKALLDALAKAGDDWNFVLADILKNATALERVQIAKALGLDPKTVEILSQGSAALKEQQKAVEDLGIALNDVDRSKLKAFSDSWSKLGATASAALEKLGAALAPIGTAIAKALQVGLEAAIREVQNFVSDVAKIGTELKNAATIGAKAIGAVVDAIKAAGSAISDFFSSLSGITWDSIANAGVQAWNALVQAVQSAGQSFASFFSSLASVTWGAISNAGVQAWNALVESVQGAGKAISDFFSGLASASWDAITNLGVQAWNALGEAVQAVIDKVKEFLGLKQPSAPATGDGGGGNGGQGLARGGLLGGRGSGTSDSNLAWVSRGEHIMPARAVAQPGVLAFLEALRHSGGNLSRVLDGMGRFALGGMVRGPIPAFAGGGLVGGMSSVTIQFPGVPPVGGLRASSAVVDELRQAAALAQVRSGGRKPSRYS